MDKKEFKVLIGDEEKTVIVSKPSPKQNTRADMYSSAIFSKLLKEKDEDGKPAYMTRAQLRNFLADAGIYSEKDLERIQEIGKGIEKQSSILKKGGKKERGKKAAIELRKLRYEFLQLMARSLEHDEHTVEAYAENARMDYLVTKCVLFEDGSQIFESVEDYEGDESLQKVLREPIRYLASIISNYDPDSDSKLIENQFLRKYNYCDDDYNLIDGEGRRVDLNGNLLDEDSSKKDEVLLGEFTD